MTLRARRRQAAVGGVVGSLVADSMVSGTRSWGERGAVAVAHAEGFLRGTPVPIDLSPPVAVPTAVGLSATGTPLLADPATVQLVDLVCSHIGRLDPPAATEGPVASATAIAERHPEFDDAIAAAGHDHDLAVLVGGLVGLRGGLAAVPARRATFVHDGNRKGRRYVVRLTERMLGIERTPFHDPNRRLGPREVAPGLWVSNLHAVGRFLDLHPEGATISLCDVEGRLDHHPHRREFHLDDTPDRDANPRLARVLDEVLDEIAAFHAEDRPVLVHCRFGASRTGLVLRAWLMETEGLDDEMALMEAQCRWPKTSSWNNRFAQVLRGRATD